MPAGGAAPGTLKQPLLPPVDKMGGSSAMTHVAIGLEQRPSVAEGVVPIVLETLRLNYYLTADKGEERRILKDVNLRFSSGVLTAVMG